MKTSPIMAHGLTIDFVDGLCGSGKTTACLSDVALYAAIGEKYVWVAPTLLLLQQTETALRAIGGNFDIRAIHSNNCEYPLADILHDPAPFAEPRPAPLITLALFPRCPTSP